MLQGPSLERVVVWFSVELEGSPTSSSDTGGGFVSLDLKASSSGVEAE